MKLRSILLAAAAAFSLQASAQVTPWVTDSVEMGTGYANDIYYGMTKGAAKTAPNNEWHLGFMMIPQGGPGSNVSIIANHVGGAVRVFSLHLKASTKFGALTGADTANKTEVFNLDSSWSVGALNRMGDPANQLDFSWGSYDMTSHFVIGDSLYMLYINGAPYQLWVKQYKSTPKDTIQYNFRIAKFDGTSDNTVAVYRKNGFTERNFAYYNVASNTILDHEPANSAWDVVFTRYKEFLNAGPGPLVPYSVTGLLSNLTVEVAKVKTADPDNAKAGTATFEDYAFTIGSNWKTFNMTTFTYDLDTVTYFIQSVDTGLYQIKFTRFDGGTPPATGKIVFAKRTIQWPQAITTVNSNLPVSKHMLVPNPAVSNTDLVLNTTAAVANAQVYITDMTGKMVQRTTVDIVKGLNAFRLNTSALAAGNYIVTITDGNWKVTDKMSVQH